jgi:hypothetical protein
MANSWTLNHKTEAKDSHPDEDNGHKKIKVLVDKVLLNWVIL